MKKFEWDRWIGIIVFVSVIVLAISVYFVQTRPKKHIPYRGINKSETKVTKPTKKKVIDSQSKLSISNIEIKTLYLKPREYGNMQIIGELKNNHIISVGVQLQATAYDKQGKIIDVQEFWPASIRNIPAGDVYPYKYYFNVKEVYRATIRVIEVRVWD